MLKKIKEHPVIIFLTLFIAIGIPLFKFITGKNSIPELLPKEETIISTPKSEPQTIINID